MISEALRALLDAYFPKRRGVFQIAADVPFSRIPHYPGGDEYGKRERARKRRRGGQ